MGIFRKSVLIGTAGLAPIKANSKKERTAKAAEKQLKIQRQMLREQQRASAAMLDPSVSAVTQHPVGSDEQRIIIASAGKTKVQVIKVVRDATGWGLKEAKAFVDRAPSSLILPADSADGLTAALRQAGATVEVEGPTSGESATAVDAPDTATVTADLERLASLHERGALTDDEFAAAKARLLTP